MSQEESPRTWRQIMRLPSGATLRLTKGEGGTFSLPLWSYWEQIARDHAAKAELCRPSDQEIDEISKKLRDADQDQPEEADREKEATKTPESNGQESGNNQEEFPSLIAVAAAAFAVDALYGAIKPLVNPPRSDAARCRQIVECLKLGFRVGPQGSEWLSEMDWLFETRDNAVHHAEEHRPLVVVRVTEHTVVAGGSESFAFSAESARRAADLCSEIIKTCIENPKPATSEWANQARPPTP
jgi:hypothetical protein